MSVTQSATRTPPEPDERFNVGETEDSLERMTDLFHRFGDIYRVWSPARKGYVYVVNHPDDVKRILVSNHRNYTKGLGLDRVKILLGNGIMTSEGEFWRKQRSMMQPMFHRRMITKFGEIIDSANDRLIERWAEQSTRGELVNVTEDISQLALDIILRAIFGDDLARIEQALGGNPFELVTKESARDLKFAYKFRQLTKIVSGLVERRRANPPGPGEEPPFDLIAMLMDARDKETGDAMGPRELIDEVMTLIVAGHETTASGLNWTWYLLSQHPEAERKLHAEIDAIPEERAPSLVAMESLQYTRQVVDEALRMYPPGWLLSRRPIEPDVLCGYEIPAGADVLFSPYLLHRHPKFWHEPEKFRPERFDEAHESERPRFAYMPFAAGPRHCIGETFSLYESYIHVAKVARRWRLVYTPDRPLEIEAQINLRTKNPLFMRLEPRR